MASLDLKTTAGQLLKTETANMPQFGSATPIPQTGPLKASASLPSGFGTDATGKIFKLPTAPTAPTSPMPVSTSQTAVQDLNQKQATVTDLSNQVALQQANKNALANVPPLPPTADEIAKSFADQSGMTPETPAAPTDPLTAQLNDINAKTDAAFQNYTTSIDQLKAGTFPLTQEQQSQVDAMQSTFQRLKDQQFIANQNYTAGMTQAGISAGRNRYAPELELGNIQNTVNVGLQKIGDIEVKANESITALKQGFQDSDYKMINEQYDKLTSFLKDKATTITDMQKSIQDHQDKVQQYNLDVAKFQEQQKQAEQEFAYKQTQDTFANQFALSKLSYQEKQDAIQNALAQGKLTQDQANNLRQYDLEIQKLNQGNYVVSQDAFGNPVAFNKQTGQFENTVLPTLGGTVPGQSEADSAFMNAFNNASLGLSAADQKTRKAALNQLLAAGDKKGAQELITRIATASATADQQNQALGRQQAIGALNDIQTLLNAYVQKSGDTNILKGSVEGAAQRIGNTSDPDLARIGSEIAQTLQVYRKSMTGVAFSPQEAAEYAKIFPDISSVDKLNATKIGALLDSFNRQQRIFIGNRIGESNYDKIYPPPQVTSVSDWKTTHADEWKNVESVGRENGWNEADTLQFINSLQSPPSSSGDFSKPLSMGEKGSSGSVDVKKIASAIGQFESGGNYKAIGPQTKTGDKAYGKYQVMGANVPSWTKEALGKSLTVQQFLNDPKAQDAVAEYKMGQHLAKYGNVEDVASIWFSGRPVAKAGNAKDVIGTSVPQYVKNVRALYNKLG